MPSCVFRRCTNYTATVRDKQNISFHALPRNTLLKEKWLNIIRTQRREEDWIPSTYSTVCSEHFLASDKYVTEKNVQRLKKTAVPVLIQKEETNVISSPTSLEQVVLSDEETIFDTPNEAFLKAEIRKISSDKRKLQLKNYQILRRYNRLKQKCNILKKLVSDLRKKKPVKCVLESGGEVL